MAGSYVYANPMSRFWNGKKVCVTGGCGFIGTPLVKRLITDGAIVTVADNLSKGSLSNLFETWNSLNLPFEEKAAPRIQAGPHRFLKLDLEKPEEAREAVQGQEVVIHLAATIGGRGYIEAHPADCTQNFSINLNVIRAAQQAGADRLAYASSACVYPQSLQEKYDSDYLLKEDDAFKDGWANCDKEYGWGKFSGEQILWAYHKQYGLKGSITRYVTAYGPRENDTHAIIALIRRALLKENPYVVWGTGEQDRDFTYVDDIVTGTLLACEKITDGTPVNLGTAKRYKLKEAAKMVLELCGHRAPIYFDKTKPEGVLSRALDITRTQKLLGWAPSISLNDGLLETIAWYRKVMPPSSETIK